MDATHTIRLAMTDENRIAAQRILRIYGEWSVKLVFAHHDCMTNVPDNSEAPEIRIDVASRWIAGDVVRMLVVDGMDFSIVRKQ